MWKSDFPVFIACQFWKDFGIFVIIRSIALWVFGVLITVLSPMVFLQLQIMQKSFMGCSVGSTLKPTKSSILTQFEEKASIVLLLWYWLLAGFFFHCFSLHLVLQQNPLLIHLSLVMKWRWNIFSYIKKEAATIYILSALSNLYGVAYLSK